MEVDRDIEIMKQSVISRNFRQRMDLWTKAFEIYNKNNTRGLSVNCFGCYTKVLNYIMQNKELWK